MSKRKASETDATNPSSKKKAKVDKKGTVGGATAGPWSKLSSILSEASLKYLTEVKGFATMAPVQAAAIPQLLKNKDVVVEAVTGSGKTLAYLVPTFEYCLRPSVSEAIEASKQAIVGLIILPTRELAMQVEKEATSYAEAFESFGQKSIVVNSFIGGREGARDVASYEKKGANIVVGTPGRLYELLVIGIEGVTMLCKTIEVLILDEADRLLAQGFSTQLDAILHRIPNQRRTGLFSATQSSAVKELVRVGMRNPVVVKVQVKKKDTLQSASKTMQVPESLASFYRVLKPSKKLEAMCTFLLENPKAKVIAYFLTCATVDYSLRAIKAAVGEDLEKAGVSLFPLHGQMPLQKRRKLFKDFKAEAKGGVLLCTDVAARGLDVADVDWVIQLDAPSDPETYIHRVGRAARMGRRGCSMIYLSPHEVSYIDYLKLQKVFVEHDDANDDGFETGSEASEEEREEDDDKDDEEEEDVADAMKEEKGVEYKTLGGMRHNEKGGIRFRVKVAARGMRDKWKGRAKRRQKAGKVQESVVVGKASDSDFVRKVRTALITDRDLNDSAVKAFVTWVRAYRDHSLRYIFKLGRVDVVDLCHAYSLLRLPSMPELSHVTMARLPMEESFMSINPKSITCTTDEKEERRQERLQVKADKDAEKRAEMSERNKKREEVKKDGTIGKRKKQLLWNQMELDELNDDARLLKKLRQGKITEAEYSKLSGEDDMELAFLPPKERTKLKLKREKEEQAQQDKMDLDRAAVDAEHKENDSDSEYHSADESEESEDLPQMPAGVELSKSGHAPQAWVQMIRQRLGRA